MNLLQKAKLEVAYLKMGFYGEAGTGKTYTSSLVAIGLSKYIKSKKPVAFASTEPGVDYVIHLFDENKVDLLVAKTRTFSKLLEITDEAEKSCAFLIVDSITHYWQELQESFMKKNNLTRINWIKHSAPIKKMWRDFTDRYINNQLHIIVCGRSSVIFEDVVDEEDGSTETRKVGTKMKTETDLGYEPSLLVEMSSSQLYPHYGSKLVRRAFIKKDRFSIMDGQMFDNPTFETFLPHIKRLNLGGEHKAVNIQDDSTAYIADEKNGERRALRREIIVEKIRNGIEKLHGGRSEEDKAKRISLMEEIFGTNSWKEIERLVKPEILEAGLKKLEKMNGTEIKEKEELKSKKGGKK